MELLKLNIQLFGASASNSGTTKSTAGNQATVAVSFSEGNYNVANNTSPISVSGSFTLNTGSFTGNHSLALYWHDDNSNSGNKLISSTPITSANRGNVFSLSGSIDVTHKNDGTLNGYAYIVWQTANGQAGTYTPAPLTVSTANTALTTIPRASSVSCSTANIGANATITITRASSSFTHTLTYNFGGATGTIATKTTSTSVSWTLPTAFYAKIPSANSGTGTITCNTYNGDTLIGTSSCSFTANVPSTAVPNKPTITQTRQDSVNLEVYVIGKSKVKLTPSAFGTNYGSTMKSRVVTFNGVAIQPDSSGNYVANVTQASNKYKVTYTDSRDKSNTSDEGSFTAYAYNAPTCSISASRNTTTPTTIDIKYSGTITNVNSNGKNAKKYKIEIKESTASSWTEVTTVTDSYTKSNATASKTGTDKAKTYDVRITAQDSYTYSTAQTQVGTEFTLMNFRADGTGMAIGKVCESASTFEVGLSTKINNTLNITGTLQHKGTNILRNNDTSTILSSKNATLYLRAKGDTDGTNQATLGTDGNFSATKFNGYTLGSACSYGVTTSVTSGSTSLITSGGVYSTTNGLQLKPTNLYNNTTGTQGTVTLSQTSANFTYLDIYFRDINNRYGCIRVYSPNGKIGILVGGYLDTGSVWYRGDQISISGTSITKTYYGQFTSGTINAQNANANFYIVRVDGWK